MSSTSLASFLRKNGYRDTQTRHMVLEAFSALKKPVSPYDIRTWIAKKHDVISVVTVYRVIDLFMKLGIVHRHPCSGKFSVCSHPGELGVHAYLHCHDCGSSEEFCSTELSSSAAAQAKRRGFSAATPMLEIVGVCRDCS